MSSSGEAPATHSDVPTEGSVVLVCMLVHIPACVPGLQLRAQSEWHLLHGCQRPAAQQIDHAEQT